MIFFWSSETISKARMVESVPVSLENAVFLLQKSKDQHGKLQIRKKNQQTNIENCLKQKASLSPSPELQHRVAHKNANTSIIDPLLCFVTIARVHQS